MIIEHIIIWISETHITEGDREGKRERREKRQIRGKKLPFEEDPDEKMIETKI